MFEPRVSLEAMAMKIILLHLPGTEPYDPARSELSRLIFHTKPSVKMHKLGNDNKKHT
jgi:hypothetical protein